ncbi:MAG: EF-P lysine aminoacylase EpmA [Desulfococcaceae bacterium]
MDDAKGPEAFGDPGKTPRRNRGQANLRLRARILRAIRAFFDGRGYLEVTTPCRVPAPAPELHIDPIAADGWFLHASPELWMKRLLAEGFDRIYQMGPVFRGSERGDRHLPEFTLLEWYAAGADYRDLMDECEALVGHVAMAAETGDRLRWGGAEVSLAPPWDRLTVRDAFRRYTNVSAEAALETDRFDEILAFEIEPRLGRERPVFLHDYPAPCAALARRRADDPDTAERFELYIAGLELCNAFSELTDPEEQRARFSADRDARKRAGRPVGPMPERFLDALAHMPAAAGNALGVDRLAMLMAGAERIDDVVAFPPEIL